MNNSLIVSIEFNFYLIKSSVTILQITFLQMLVLLKDDSCYIVFFTHEFPIVESNLILQFCRINNVFESTFL